MKTYMKKVLIMVFLFIGLSIMNFSTLVYGEEPADSGLSLANVQSIYHTNDKILQIRFLLLNTSSENITVLTDHLNTQYLKDSNKYVIGVGSMTAKYQGYNIVQSLYKFAPVALKPKEGTGVNHLIKRTFKDINKNTDFIVRYEIREKIWNAI